METEIDVIQMIEDDSIALGELMTPDLVLIATWDRVSKFANKDELVSYRNIIYLFQYVLFSRTINK
jgi:hypothetical protein